MVEHLSWVTRHPAGDHARAQARIKGEQMGAAIPTDGQPHAAHPVGVDLGPTQQRTQAGAIALEQHARPGRATGKQILGQDMLVRLGEAIEGEDGTIGVL
ncbi:MAG TPA: hypothetical protein DIC52_09030 [Candidatus Latescibacteria bacterium]|nr:hypothetical protein [Candidatus Latescibacterota bacterium]